MTPIAWLRSRRSPAAEPKATGGIVGDYTPLKLAGCTASARPPADVPTGIITIVGDLSENDVAQFREAVRAAFAPHEPGLLHRPLDDAPTDCPCVGIYSRCHCPART